jgi:hypothetical protein
MLTTKLLRVKKFFTNAFGESVIDLASSTFSFGEATGPAGPVVISEFENMRPDLVSDRVLGSQEYWEALLKFNGISNPFSIEQGEIILVPGVSEISKLIVPPKSILEKGTEPTKKNEDAVIRPKTAKDQQRLQAIRSKVPEVVPPNVNLSGAKNVKVVEGRVILGGDMTQTSATNTNQAAARSRIQDQLKNGNNF